MVNHRHGYNFICEGENILQVHYLLLCSSYCFSIHQIIYSSILFYHSPIFFTEIKELGEEMEARPAATSAPTQRKRGANSQHLTLNSLLADSSDESADESEENDAETRATKEVSLSVCISI